MQPGLNLHPLGFQEVWEWYPLLTPSTLHICKPCRWSGDSSFEDGVAKLFPFPPIRALEMANGVHRVPLPTTQGSPVYMGPNSTGSRIESCSTLCELRSFFHLRIMKIFRRGCRLLFPVRCALDIQTSWVLDAAHTSWFNNRWTG